MTHAHGSVLLVGIHILSMLSHLSWSPPPPPPHPNTSCPQLIFYLPPACMLLLAATWDAVQLSTHTVCPSPSCAWPPPVLPAPAPVPPAHAVLTCRCCLGCSTAGTSARPAAPQSLAAHQTGAPPAHCWPGTGGLLSGAHVHTRRSHSEAGK
jgi:hypothetical protein